MIFNCFYYLNYCKYDEGFFISVKIALFLYKFIILPDVIIAKWKKIKVPHYYWQSKININTLMPIYNSRSTAELSHRRAFDEQRSSSNLEKKRGRFSRSVRRKSQNAS